MDKGTIVWQGPPRDLFEEERLSSWGLELPPLAYIWRELRKKGLINGTYPPRIESMVDDLCR